MVMIPRIGIDIADIDPFRAHAADKNRVFLKKIFTSAELAYCFDAQDPAPHLAVRFAAKEAVVKALALTDLPRPEYRDIEVVRDESGAPSIVIHTHAGKDVCARISLSHAKDVAVAVVLLDMSSEITI